MNPPPSVHGLPVLPEPPPGFVPVFGPVKVYEVRMLERAVADFVSTGTECAVCIEKARRNQGAFVGLSVWRPRVVRPTEPMQTVGRSRGASLKGGGGSS